MNINIFLFTLINNIIMPKSLRKDITTAKELLDNADTILVITGAGMSVDSGIPTYRGRSGLWEKSIQIGDKSYGYDDISSLDMWKSNPKLAWGFKSHFYNLSNERTPHEGYYNLLENVNKKEDYFICTSNVDGYFRKVGFDTSKLYEVHGTIDYLQCMDINCNKVNGIVATTPDIVPDYDNETFISKTLPTCKYCKKMLRPNISVFGDFEFYGKPYEHQRRRLDEWLTNIKKNNKTLVILEIGCGINPHSLRMSDGKMMSGEWKMPVFDNNIGTIRLNPTDEQSDEKTIHVSMGAKNGIRSLFS